MKWMAGIFIFSFSLSCAAADSNAKAVVSESQILAVIHYGELTTTFVVRGGVTPSIQMTNSNGVMQSHELSAANFDFIVTQFKKLKTPPKVPNECYRLRMDVQFSDTAHKVTQQASCIGTKTITSDQYARFAHILVLAAR